MYLMNFASAAVNRLRVLQISPRSFFSMAALTALLSFSTCSRSGMMSFMQGGACASAAPPGAASASVSAAVRRIEQSCSIGRIPVAADRREMSP